MYKDQLLDNLIKSLCILPGVGPKTAQRMAYSLLQKYKEQGLILSETLKQALLNIKHCTGCRTYTEHELCYICSSVKRQQSQQLCVVEMPSDVAAIEHTGQYFGKYFVLLGKLSPIDGIGPKEIGLDILQKKINSLDLTEIILAINPSVEGEVTINYIANMCANKDILITRIVHGIPIGGELDNIDGITLTHSFVGRRTVN